MVYYIKNFGAIPDTEDLQTEKIQAAIDCCSFSGGGRVIIEGGRYKISTIIMKNNVELHINSDSILVASDNCNDFTELSGLKHVNSQKLPRFRNSCIIFAEETEKIALTGYGTIDCSGNKFVEKSDDYRMPYKRLDIPTPPRAAFFTGCKNVRIENITMQNQPAG